MNGASAERAPRPLQRIALPVLGILILGVLVFAVLNVDKLEGWGAALAERFHGEMSLPFMILVVFVAGVITSLTPCVYPVIPLAVTYLGARGASSRLKAFSLAGVYVAGMVATYTALGAGAGLTGTAFGAATQKWWIYAGVATVVLVFGLSMMGLFTIQLPGVLQRLAGKGKGPGYKGAFFMGATSGLVTAPCTAPVLGALIIPMIARRSVALGSLLLAVFGLGMGMLFLIVGTYSGALTRLPRSGRWMNAVKLGLGAAIILVAGYFYYKAWTMFPLRSASPATSTAALDANDGPEGSRALTLASALAPFAERGSAGATDKAPDVSIEDLRGKVHQLAKLRGKTVHIAFFALWCPPCLEQLTRVELADARLRGRGYAGIAIGLKDRESAEDLRAFAAQRTLAFPVAYDASGEIASAFGVSAVPAHVVISPDGTIIFRGRDLPAGFETNGAGLLPK